MQWWLKVGLVKNDHHFRLSCLVSHDQCFMTSLSQHSRETCRLLGRFSSNVDSQFISCSHFYLPRRETSSRPVEFHLGVREQREQREQRSMERGVFSSISRLAYIPLLDRTAMTGPLFHDLLPHDCIWRYNLSRNRKDDCQYLDDEVLSPYTPLGFWSSNSLPPEGFWRGGGIYNFTDLGRHSISYQSLLNDPWLGTRINDGL